MRSTPSRRTARPLVAQIGGRPQAPADDVIFGEALRYYDGPLSGVAHAPDAAWVFLCAVWDATPIRVWTYWPVPADIDPDSHAEHLDAMAVPDLITQVTDRALYPTLAVTDDVFGVTQAIAFADLAVLPATLEALTTGRGLPVGAVDLDADLVISSLRAVAATTATVEDARRRLAVEPAGFVARP